MRRLIPLLLVGLLWSPTSEFETTAMATAVVNPPGNPWDDLVNILCGASGTDVPGVPRSLSWQIAVRDIATGQLTNVASDTATYNLSIQPIWFGAVVHFDNVTTAGLPADVELDVDVEFILDWFHNPGLLSMNIDADIIGAGAAGKSIQAVRFPIVEVNATEDYNLTWPIGTGIVFENPMTHPVVGILGNFTRHPGPASMQWWCLYPSDQTTCFSPSFYMSTQDEEGVYKEYVLAPIVDGLRFSVRHIPPNNFVANSYEAPFNTVMGVVGDDWYQAASRYRKWAECMPWTSQGPMRSDPDFSQACEDMAMFGIFSPDTDSDSWLPWPDRHQEQTTLFGTPNIVPQNYGWYDHGFDRRFGDWNPRSEYLQAAAQMAALGVKASPYTYINSISTGSEPNIPGYTAASVIANTVIRENGTLSTSLDLDGQVTYEICQSTQYASDYATWLAERVEGYGAGGIYLDVLNTLAPQLCYSTTHGHEAADPLNTRRRTDAVRAIRTATTDPDFYVSSESVNEMYLGDMELGMSQWTRNLLGEVVTYFPLFETVYHRYLRIGRLGVVLNFDTEKLPPLVSQLLARQTYAAHIFMGWTPFAGSLINPDTLADNRAAAPVWDLFIGLVDDYMDFLTREEVVSHVNFGERLQDPDAYVATVDLSFLGVLLRLLTVPYGPVQPAVYISSWGDPDEGSIMVLLENWTDAIDNAFAATITTQSTVTMDSVSLGFNPLWFEEYSPEMTCAVSASNVQQICFQGGPQPYGFTIDPKACGYWAKKWEVWHYPQTGEPTFIGVYNSNQPIQLGGLIDSRSIEGYLLKPKYW